MAESSGGGILCVGVGAEPGLGMRALSRFPLQWVSVEPLCGQQRCRQHREEGET